MFEYSLQQVQGVLPVQHDALPDTHVPGTVGDAGQAAYQIDAGAVMPNLGQGTDGGTYPPPRK